MDGDYSLCDFPNTEAGHTMDTAELSFGEEFIDYLGKQGQSKYRLADRLQCAKNPILAQQQIDAGYKGEKGMTETFFGLELFLVTVFVLDLTLRLVVATAPRDLNWCDWFSDLANWIDIIAVLSALIEIVGNVVNFDGDPRYQVWGWMWVRSVDPATFRILRGVVSIRFMLQQRHFKDTKIITDTVRQVLSRLAVPLLMFFLLASMFGGLLYYVEGGSLYECQDWEHPSQLPVGPNKTVNCVRCGGPPWLVPFGNPVGNLFGLPERPLDWSDDWLGHEEWYNSTCRFLHTAPIGASTGVGAIESMQTPLIIDAFDGLWTIIVTMTTVGYGGKRPHTPLGKSVVVVAAFFGAFYLAMPLSIIATAFNKNYLLRQEQEEKEKKIRMRNQMLQGGKLKFMHIVRLKLWAKRAVERAKGHHHGNDHEVPPPATQIIRYMKALHLVCC